MEKVLMTIATVAIVWGFWELIARKNKTGNEKLGQSLRNIIDDAVRDCGVSQDERDWMFNQLVKGKSIRDVEKIVSGFKRKTNEDILREFARLHKRYKEALVQAHSEADNARNERQMRRDLWDKISEGEE